MPARTILGAHTKLHSPQPTAFAFSLWFLGVLSWGEALVARIECLSNSSFLQCIEKSGWHLWAIVDLVGGSWSKEIAITLCCIDWLLEMEKKVDSPKPDLAFKILVFLEKVPTYLKQGPWSPVAHLYLIVLCGYILLSFDYAVALYGEVTDVNSVSFASNALAGSNDWIQNYRFYGAAYMLCILALVIYTSGVWPLASYTVTSWNLTTIRLIASFIGASNLSFSPQFQTVAGKTDEWKLMGLE